MKKFVNVRFPVITACSLAVGIAAGYIIVHYGVDAAWLAALAIPAAVLVIILTVIKKSLKPLIFIAFSLIFLFLGVFTCICKLNGYKSVEYRADGVKIYEVSGTVKEKGKTDSGEYVIITDVKLTDENPKSGDAILYLNNAYGEFCDIDYDVTFSATIEQLELFEYGKLNYNAERNVKYRCNLQGRVKSKYNFSLFGTIKKQIKTTLFDNLDGETAAICYGMLTGDSDAIEEQSLENFRYGGIAHIFAVSGLHIGIVYGAISFILKRLRVNRYVSAVLCVFAVFFYAGICGFSISSLRAAIMCAVAAGTRLLHVKYDGLNSLSFAVIIILLISPLNLFSIGFKLSVAAVGGIFAFSKMFSAAMTKVKIHRKVADTVSLSLAAQAGTLPVSLVNFGYLSGAGLLLNIVIIPIVSVLFTIVLAGTFLSVAIAAVAPYVLPVAVTPLEALLSFLIGAGFEKAAITGFGAGFFIVLYYGGALLLSDKLNLTAFARIICVCLATIAVAGYVLYSTYSPFYGFSVTVSGYGGSGHVIIKSTLGSILVLTEDSDGRRVLQDLNNCYCGNLNAIIILGGEDCAMKYQTFGIGCENVFIFQNYIDVQPYDGIKINYKKEFAVCGAYFKFEDGYTLTAALDGTNVRICGGQKVSGNDCDLLISRYRDKSGQCSNTVYFGTHTAGYNVYKQGALTYKTYGGKINLCTYLPS